MMKTLHKWEGWVEEITGDTFWAELITVEGEGAETRARSCGDIFISKVHPDDRALIEPGAYFYWIIEQDEHGVAHSTIRFHRFEPLSKADIDQAIEAGRELHWMLNE